MRYQGHDAVLDPAASPAPSEHGRTYWRWLLPVLGGGWLLFVGGTSAYLLHREFYADQSRQLWCGTAICAGLVRPPHDVVGVLLAVVAVALFVGLFVVPHRGSLRLARTAMLAALIAASWSAETLLLAPFFQR